MSLSIIIVGIDNWDKFTLPAVLSFRKFNPNTKIVVVDAASKVPYPDCDYCDILRLNNSPSYSFAINEGVKFAGNSDWYLVLNNDVVSYGKIVTGNLDSDVIYGKQIIEEAGHRWLGLWIAMISKETFSSVGRFDEKFLLCGFEDADFCIRAKEHEINVDYFDFPVKHFWGKTRWGIPNYKQVRMDNIDYLEKKIGVRLGKNLVVVHD